MNLFFNPSPSEFQKLISKTKSDKPVHDVVVDYDGEVLVDPQLEQPELDLNKFKVHLLISEHSKNAMDKKSNMLKDLFNSVLNAWNDNKYPSRPVALFSINPFKKGVVYNTFLLF